ATTGFYVPFNAKGLAQLKAKNGNRLLVATQNRGPLKIFSQPLSSLVWIDAQPTDAYALIRTKDGKTQRQELYYGASFLSQSARRLVLTGQETAVEMVDFKQKKRKVR
ncbi:MAG: hypothetical protein EAZ14_09085, partial [Runella slithyformis]